MTGPKRVYFTCTPPKELIRFAEQGGCDIRFADPLLPGAPHCNKILPFLDDHGFADQIVTDTDVFLLADLVPLFRQDQVRLAPNNHANPPLDIFTSVFKAAGLTTLPEPGLALFNGASGRETYNGNASAGVIAIPSALRDFAEIWRRRASWLLDHKELLKRFTVHIDQISFAVAANEQKLPFTFLPPQANAILQLLPEIDTVYALHLTSGHIPKFPDWFTPDGALVSDQINPKLATQLTEFNAHVAQAMKDIEAIPDLAKFRPNFLSPAYQRAVSKP